MSRVRRQRDPLRRHGRDRSGVVPTEMRRRLCRLIGHKGGDTHSGLRLPMPHVGAPFAVFRVVVVGSQPLSPTLGGRKGGCRRCRRWCQRGLFADLKRPSVCARPPPLLTARLSCWFGKSWTAIADAEAARLSVVSSGGGDFGWTAGVGAAGPP